MLIKKLYIKDRIIKLIPYILAAIICFFILLYVFGYNPTLIIIKPFSGIILQYDLSKMDNADIAKIALNDPAVKDILKNHTYDNIVNGNNIYRIENISIDNENSSGFISDNNTYYKVTLLITGTKDYFDTIKLNVIIDNSSKSVLSKEYTHLIAWPISENVTIPNNTYWYHKLVVPSSRILSMQPNNTKLYLSLLDEYNFNKFLNGEPVEAFSFDGNASEWVKTSIPFDGNISTRKIPNNNFPYNDNETNYLVIKSINNTISLQLTL